jgi:glucose-6-phosphate dehydrogenase assembly protein OpcA
MWSGASEQDAGTTRACTLNLIVYATPEDKREQLDDLLDEVNERSPGRTLILVADRAAKDAALDAYVSMRCRVLGDSGKQICGEQVTINASGGAVDTVSSAVSPLLVPDVPVYLWWKAMPAPGDRLFDRLARMADRVIVDSSAFVHPPRDLVQLHELISANVQAIHVSDVNWGRLTPWRSLLASFWDVPDYRPHLDAIDAVEIGYHPPGPAPAEIASKALLMVGWLAARLRWDGDHRSIDATTDPTRFKLRAGTRAIDVSLRRDCTTGRNDARICAVTLRAGNDASFSVKLSPDIARLTTEARVGNAHAVGRTIDYIRRSEAESLSRELDFVRRDAIFEAALSRVATLLA